MKRRTVFGISIMIVVIAAVVSVSLMYRPRIPANDTTDTIPVSPDENVLDMLYADKAKISAIDREGCAILSGVEYEITPVGDNAFYPIGSINDTRTIDGEGLGFRIIWNGTTYSGLLRFVILLSFPSEFAEDVYDFRPNFTVSIRHNESIDYTFSVLINQLEFWSEEPNWSFEKNGTCNNVSNYLNITTDVLDNSSYQAIRNGRLEPMLTLWIPIEKNYITEIFVDYASVEVWESLE